MFVELIHYSDLSMETSASHHYIYQFTPNGQEIPTHKLWGFSQIKIPINGLNSKLLYMYFDSLINEILDFEIIFRFVKKDYHNLHAQICM